MRLCDAGGRARRSSSVRQMMESKRQRADQKARPAWGCGNGGERKEERGCWGVGKGARGDKIRRNNSGPLVQEIFSGVSGVMGGAQIHWLRAGLRRQKKARGSTWPPVPPSGAGPPCATGTSDSEG